MGQMGLWLLDLFFFYREARALIPQNFPYTQFYEMHDFKNTNKEVDVLLTQAYYPLPHPLFPQTDPWILHPMSYGRGMQLICALSNFGHGARG